MNYHPVRARSRPQSFVDPISFPRNLDISAALGNSQVELNAAMQRVLTGQKSPRQLR